jgi:hypothetical protein
VTGKRYVGGLVGTNGDTVLDCYSTGSVTGDYDAGGLVGKNYQAVSDCFWDTQTSGQATSDGGTGKTHRTNEEHCHVLRRRLEHNRSRQS